MPKKQSLAKKEELLFKAFMEIYEFEEKELRKRVKKKINLLLK